MIVFIERLIRRHARLVKFLISGGTATLSNLIVIYLLTDLLHIYYLVSSGVSFIIAFLVSFTLQKFWTFNNPGLDVVHKQLVIGILVAGGNLVLNTFLMFIFVQHVGLHYLFGQLVTSAIIACETFFVYKHVMFRPSTLLSK